MEDFAVVAVFQPQAHLRKIVQDLVLGEVLIILPMLSDNGA